MNHNHISFQFKTQGPNDYGLIEQVMQQFDICKTENVLLDVSDSFRGDDERLIVMEDKVRHRVLASYFQNGDDASLTLNIPFKFIGRGADFDGDNYELVIDTSDYPGVFGRDRLKIHVPQSNRVCYS